MHPGLSPHSQQTGGSERQGLVYAFMRLCCMIRGLRLALLPFKTYSMVYSGLGMGLGEGESKSERRSELWGRQPRAAVSRWQQPAANGLPIAHWLVASAQTP